MASPSPVFTSAISDSQKAQTATYYRVSLAAVLSAPPLVCYLLLTLSSLLAYLKFLNQKLRFFHFLILVYSLFHLPSFPSRYNSCWHTGCAFLSGDAPHKTNTECDKLEEWRAPSPNKWESYSIITRYQPTCHCLLSFPLLWFGSTQLP